jgi:uncharacterized membrane protein (UPF0182 family)
MYALLLPLHSLIRWLVLIALLFSVAFSYWGWYKHRAFSTFAEGLRRFTLGVVQMQFLIGLILYFLSPVVSYFLHNFKAAVHMREIRFFGMEHITMMFVAVAVITVGAGRVGKMTTDDLKYKTMWIWFGIGLLIILSSIPWSFSPLTSRPSFRPFNF